MSRSVYNYTISVLKKVSFNQVLFNKELKKASKRLLPYEYRELIILVKKYSEQRPELELVIG